MKTVERKKHIMGYLVGLTIFVLTIPCLIYLVSYIDHPFFRIQIIKSTGLRLGVAIPLFVFGLVFTIWSNLDLLKKGKGGPTDVFNVEISPRTKHLVVSGPYGYTRNPMVLGINSMYFALALVVNALASLIFCLSFFSVIVFYLKRTEEKRLLHDFGHEYRKYKKSVPMIFPFAFQSKHKKWRSKK